MRLYPKRSALGALVAGVLLCAGGGLIVIHRAWSRLPDEAAQADLAPLGLLATEDLFSISPLGRSESERRLTLEGHGARLRVDLAFDWGPARRTGFYAFGEHGLAVLGPAGEARFFSVDPLREVGAPRGSSDGWTYLGVLDFVRARRIDDEGREVTVRSFRFIPPSEQDECIPILMDEPSCGPWRQSHQRRDCDGDGDAKTGP